MAIPAQPETFPSELTFRTGSVHDLDALYALDCICFDPPFRFSRAQTRHYLKHPGAIVPIAETPDGIAGFAIAHVDKSAAYLMTLDVALSHRKRGLGRQLLQLAEQACADAGATTLWLHVWVRNEAAIRLYERSGFDCQGTEKDFYPRHNDALVFRKKLASGNWQTRS